ncbi:Serine/threonine-protein kinase TIO [Vanrija pseudolonga]|uniref:Serine/threonine-protein kinase TIO n=1 Tax=Vanrija pseudolonga TaxID=143232 RepID=A0AAF0YET4_9TREE|nr:Serine/threonine-protein kinase TIO [Vanrija pseudolonga]
MFRKLYSNLTARLGLGGTRPEVEAGLTMKPGANAPTNPARAPTPTPSPTLSPPALPLSSSPALLSAPILPPSEVATSNVGVSFAVPLLRPVGAAPGASAALALTAAYLAIATLPALPPCLPYLIPAPELWYDESTPLSTHLMNGLFELALRPVFEDVFGKWCKMINPRGENGPIDLYRSVEQERLVMQVSEYRLWPGTRDYWMKQGEKPLGSGSFGSVFTLSGYRARKWPIKMALKILTPEEGSTSRPGAMEVKAMRFFRREYRYPHLIHSFFDHYDNTARETTIGLPLAETSLWNAIEKGILSLEEKLSVARQVVGALAHMHKLRWVHLDIKPCNILVMSTNPLHVVLADLGNAERIPKGAYTIEGGGGTPGFMAPETLRDDDWCGYTSDIFALGVTFYSLFSGKVDMVPSNWGAMNGLQGAGAEDVADLWTIEGDRTLSFVGSPWSSGGPFWGRLERLILDMTAFETGLDDEESSENAGSNVHIRIDLIGVVWAMRQLTAMLPPVPGSLEGDVLDNYTAALTLMGLPIGDDEATSNAVAQVTAIENATVGEELEPAVVQDGEACDPPFVGEQVSEAVEEMEGEVVFESAALSRMARMRAKTRKAPRKIAAAIKKAGQKVLRRRA